MGAYDSILSVSIGTASFQATGFSVSDTAIESGGAQTGRKIEVSVTGWIDGASAAAFASAAAAVADMAVAGRDLVIKGVGGNTVYSLLAAECMDGGPLYDVTMAPGGSALHAEVTIKARGTKSSDNYSSGPQSGGGAGKTTQVRVTRDAADTYQIVVTGELRGPDTATAMAGELESWQTAYPWPDWVVSSEYTTNLEGDKRQYQISVQELMEPLPAGNNGVRGVDGSHEMSVGVDEFGRRTTTWSFDLLCDGDPWAVEAKIRPTGGVIVSSSVTVSGYKELRLRATYTSVGSDFGNRLVEWTQTIEVQGEDPTARAVDYDGVSTVLVYNRTKALRMRQSGRAIGQGGAISPPTYENVNGYALSEARRVSYAKINEHFYETTWEYQLVGTRGVAGADLAGLIGGMGRPKTPVVTYEKGAE